MALELTFRGVATEAPLVSIVVVAFNSGALLVECVRDALASEVAIEVIVSDNGSNDGSMEAVEYLSRTENRLHVLRNGHNLGFAAANNRALTKATGQYVLFLNPDCLIGPDTVGRMVAVLEADPGAGMAGCLIRNPDSTVDTNCRRLMPTPVDLLAKLVGMTSRRSGLAATGRDVEAISGAFMLVRRADLDRIGSFDEGYFLHWEDLDLCRRFRDAGRKILFMPEVEVLHFKGRSSRHRPLWVEWQKHRGLARYLRKFHFAGWPLPIFMPIALAIGARFLVHVAVARRTRPGDLQPTGASRFGGQAAEVWVFGATSVVGQYLLPRLLAAGFLVRAFSRDPARAEIGVSPRLTLSACDLHDSASLPAIGRPEAVINLAPIFAFSKVLPVLAQRGARRVITFGSTSVITKAGSRDEGEQKLVRLLTDGEAAVRRECATTGLRWVVFRPTMIYSWGRDRNVTRLAGFIRRFGYLLLPGKGTGLRQPVHADDLAQACVNLLRCDDGWCRTYELSGGEVLTYRAMVGAIARRLGRRARIIGLPKWLLRPIVAGVRLLPGFRDVNLAMLERVDIDMSFSHDEATRAFGFVPRKFVP